MRRALKDAADRLLPPFIEGIWEKPRDMLYTALDRPPWSTTLNTAVQHTLVALMFLVYSVIAGHAIGLTGAYLRDFMAIAILIMGFGTLLNSLTTRVSPGHLLVKIPDPITLAVFIPVIQVAGPSATFGGVLASGILLLIMARFLSVLRLLFPAEVTGVVLILLGMSLVGGGIERAAGLNVGLDNGHAAAFDLDALLIATATLVPIIALSVWSRSRARVFAMPLGIAAGLLLAVLTGHFGAAQMTEITAQPLFALPGEHYRPAAPSLELSAMIPLLLISFALAADNIGVGVMVDKMNRDNWVRMDLPMIGRLLSGLGICNLLSGLTGTAISNLSSANAGLVQVTGVAARRAGVLTGLLLMTMAFLPLITTFVMLWPQAVVGAILIYTAAYMMVSGAELILSRLLDARRRATVGLSLVGGTAVFIVPELTARLPADIAPLLGSGLLVGTLLAILLNLLFRIGVSRHAELLLDSLRPDIQATRFLEDCGADWGARRDVILRAGTAVGEALEALRNAGAIDGPARLMVRFDELRLQVDLDYPGQVVALAAAGPADIQALLDADDDDTALDRVMAGISGTLICSLADRVEASGQPGRGELRLQFAH